MTPELSRRIGKLMITKTILGLQWDKYDEFVAAVEKADTFDQLPGWVQQIVRQAEKEVKNGEKGEPSKEKKFVSRKIIPIAKMDQARQIVYGIVLDPYIVDSQGDWVPVLEVEKAAHGYMKSQTIGDQHEKKADAELVESWLVPYPTPEDYQKAIAGEPHKVYQFKFGEGEVHSGAWVVGIHVIDKRLWQEVMSGAKTGLSIGAVGERIRNAKVSMPEFETVEPETVPTFIATH